MHFTNTALALSVSLLFPCLGISAEVTKTAYGKEPGRLTSWVDPFIGTGITTLPVPKGIAKKWSWLKTRHGHLHPGATLPFGFVSVLPYGSGYPTGYWRGTGGQPCSGFTHFQQSGTGKISSYYNYFLVSPLRGRLSFVPPGYVLSDEWAAPGIYRAAISSAAMEAAVTVTRHGSFHQYEFSGDSPSHLVVNLAQAYDGPVVRTVGRPTFADYVLISPTTAEGKIVIDGLPLHFRLEVGGAVSRSGAWAGDAELPVADRYGLAEKPFGLWFSFVPGTTMAKVKITFSFKSVEQARTTLAMELPGWDFEAVAGAAGDTWERQLDVFRIEGGTRDERTLFYTALFRSLHKPLDGTGENPFWESSLPWYSDFATLWDTYKTQMPFLMSFYPERGSDIVNSLLNVAQHHGRFPIGYVLPDRLGFDDQGINFAHIVIADAFAKDLPGIDWSGALPLLLKSLRKTGQYGDTALHYAYASACLVPMAEAVGDQKSADALSAQAQTWQQALDPKTHKLPPIPGAAFDGSFYEGGVWNYSFTVPHNMAGLIGLYPSREAFVEELDRFFGFVDTTGVNIPFEGLNNQPDMEVPFAYLYAGRPDRTQEVVHAVRRYRFATGRGGWPGNDDSGGTAAWYVWNGLGLFPVVGRGLYLIGTPEFPRISIRLAKGAFTIEAPGVSDKAFYIQAAELNGVPLNRPFLWHAELIAGGRLVLHMGEKPSAWGSNEVPPSGTAKHR